MRSTESVIKNTVNNKVSGINAHLSPPSSNLVSPKFSGEKFDSSRAKKQNFIENSLESKDQLSGGSAELIVKEVTISEVNL